MEQVKKLKKECKTENGGYNMCKGMRDWLEEKEESGKREGRKQGIQALIETCQELGLSRHDTTKRVGKKFSLNVDDTEKYLEKYWK